MRKLTPTVSKVLHDVWTPLFMNLLEESLPEAYENQPYYFIIYYEGVTLSYFNSKNYYFFSCARTSKQTDSKNLIFITNFNLYSRVKALNSNVYPVNILQYSKNWYSDRWFIDIARQRKIKLSLVEGGQCISPTSTWLW